MLGPSSSCRSHRSSDSCFPDSAEIMDQCSSRKIPCDSMPDHLLEAQQSSIARAISRRSISMVPTRWLEWAQLTRGLVRTEMQTTASRNALLIEMIIRHHALLHFMLVWPNDVIRRWWRKKPNGLPLFNVKGLGLGRQWFSHCYDSSWSKIPTIIENVDDARASKRKVSLYRPPLDSTVQCISAAHGQNCYIRVAKSLH